MTDPERIRVMLAREFDPAAQRRIKRLWVRHPISEDRRDIDGVIATLSEHCADEAVPTGHRWDGHDGARRYSPWDPVTERFTGERIWFDRGVIAG